MGKIFMIIGPIASGKDIIYKVLKGYYPQFKPIITYTTRPITEDERDGHKYHFISNDELNNMIQNGEILKIIECNNKDETWKEAISTKNIDLENKNYLTISTLDTYKALTEYYGKDSVIPFIIRVSEQTRYKRALERIKHEKNPDYNSLAKKFEEDKKNFNYKNISNLSIHEFYENEVLSLCVNKIRNKINCELREPKKEKKKI